MKRIVINDKFTYETDLPVGVGDVVDLPSKTGGHWQGTVTALKSSYDGECRSINFIVRSAALEQNNRTIDETIAEQPAGVADAIRQIVRETELYGPVTLGSFAAAAGRLLLAAQRAQQSHRPDRALPKYMGG